MRCAFCLNSAPRLNYINSYVCASLKYSQNLSHLVYVDARIRLFNQEVWYPFAFFLVRDDQRVN